MGNVCYARTEVWQLLGNNFYNSLGLYIYTYIYVCVCVCVCVYIYLKMFYLYFFDYIFHFHQSFCKLFWSCHCQYFCFHYLNLFIFNWRTIALRHCVGFCHTSTWSLFFVFVFLIPMNHPFSQESSLWPSEKWDHCGHSDTQIHSQGGIRPWDSEICRMEVSKDAMAAVFGFTPKGRKQRVERAEWQPGSHHPVFVHLTCGQGNLAAEVSRGGWPCGLLPPHRVVIRAGTLEPRQPGSHSAIPDLCGGTSLSPWSPDLEVGILHV